MEHYIDQHGTLDSFILTWRIKEIGLYPISFINKGDNMRKINFTEICIVLIMAFISLIVNIFSGYYIKITDGQMIDNKFYTSDAKGININSDFDISDIRNICKLNNNFVLYKSLTSGGQKNDVRGLYYSGDIHIPPMLEGIFLKEGDFDDNSKYAVIGKSIIENVVEIENKKYFEYYGEMFEVIGITGVNRPSDLDNMVFLNLNAVASISDVNGMYLVDGKSKISIDKVKTDLKNIDGARVEEIELDLGSTEVGLTLVFVYILTIISLISSAILILYYYIEREKKKIAIKKLCGFNNRSLIKETVLKQFILVFVGFVIGTFLFIVLKSLFEIDSINIFNIVVAYLLVILCNIAILINPLRRVLTIDISILLK